MKRNSYNHFFMNFASPLKFGIIMSLKEGPLSVSEIVKKVGEEQSTVSHNLRKLNHCNILKVEKVGKKRIYSLNEDTVKPMLKIVEKHVKTSCRRKCCV